MLLIEYFKAAYCELTFHLQDLSNLKSVSRDWFYAFYSLAFHEYANLTVFFILFIYLNF